jgi:hypothetical protein
VGPAILMMLIKSKTRSDEFEKLQSTEVEKGITHAHVCDLYAATPSDQLKAMDWEKIEHKFLELYKGYGMTLRALCISESKKHRRIGSMALCQAAREVMPNLCVAHDMLIKAYEKYIEDE